MTNEEIVLVSMGCATLVIAGWKLLQHYMLYRTFKWNEKRVAQLRELLKQEKCQFKLIDLGDEPNRIAPPPQNSDGLYIDGKLYNSKNAFLIEQKEGLIYVYGKKEDFIIAIAKAGFDYEIK